MYGESWQPGKRRSAASHACACILQPSSTQCTSVTFAAKLFTITRPGVLVALLTPHLSTLAAFHDARISAHSCH